jgi:hypothetical protein
MKELLKEYANLFLSSAAAGALSAGAVASSTTDTRPIVISFVMAAATAVVQHLRKSPKAPK